MKKHISGIEQRKNNKEKKLKRIKAKLEIYIHKNLECINDPSCLTNEIFELNFNEIMLKIKNDHPGYRMFVHGNNYISSLIEELVNSGKCIINIPQKLHLKQTPAQFRDLLWFEANSQLCDLMKYLQQDTLRKIKQDFEYRITRLILSAVTTGGLNFSIGLLALINQLIIKDKPLRTFNDIYYIDLEIIDNSFPITEVVEETEIYVHRWFPDTNSLLWIINILNQKEEFSKQFNYKELNKMVINRLKSIAGENRIDIGKISNIKQICKLGVGISELLPGVKLNQTLINYATGNVKSPSLPFSKLKLITEDKYVECKLKEEYHSYSKNKQVQLSSVYLEILDVFKEKQHRLPSIAKVKDDLEALLEECDSTIESSFISWLLHNINDRKNSIRTLKNHISYIGKPWLESAKEKLDVTNSEALSSFYSKIIDFREKNNNPTIDEFTRSLKLFHEFCAYRNIFADVDIFDNLSTTRNFLRTGFITEKLFKKFLINIDKYSDYKYMMCSFFIILFRSGLRYREVRCLKINDIELSDELYITNKKNDFKTIKSYSGKRKFPLGIFLKEEEKQILLKYIKNKLNKNNVTRSSMLFSHDNTPNRPIGTQIPSSTFNKLLKKKYDLPLVIHDMRHTALSRLHIIIENNVVLIKKFTDYNEAQILKIRTHLNSEGKNSYWALSSCAGHANPSMTFTHYLHFTDFILYTVLSQNSDTLNFESIQSMSGLSRQYLNRNLNAKASNNDKFKLNQIYHALTNSLNSHCKNSGGITTQLKKDEEELDIKYVLFPYDVFLILRKMEGDTSLKEVAKESLMNTDSILHYLNNAEYLANLTNQKNKPKLFTSSCIKNAKQKLLVPREPSSSSEKYRCNELLVKFVNYFKYKPNDCKRLVLYCVDNISNSGIVFKNPDDLGSLLNIISPTLKKKNINIRYRLAAKVNIKDQVPLWKSAIDNRANFDFKNGKDNNKISKVKQYPIGQAILEIRHPQEKYKIEASQNTDREISLLKSNLLKFVVHLMAIYILDLPEDLINNT